MTRATRLLIRAVFIVLAVLPLCAATATAAVTTYPDLESFLAAAGAEGLTHEGFDSFDSGTPIDDQIPGVVFSSPNSGFSGYAAIQTLAHSAASSAPSMLVGGSVPGVESPYLQVIVLDFDPAITAFSFYLTAYNPAATPASVEFVFDDESTATLPLSNGSGDESTPVFFGAVADRPIARVTLTSGTQSGVFEELSLSL